MYLCDMGERRIDVFVYQLLTLRLTPVSHGSFWDTDMDTVCLPGLDVFGSDCFRTVSLPVVSIKLAIACSLFV